MYKFLICQTVDDKDVWFLSFNSKMFPKFSQTVKEAALLGYWSRKQDKWITSGTAIKLRNEYQNVKHAMSDSELTAIMLGLDIKELKNIGYIPFEGIDMFSTIYSSGVVEL